MIEPRALVAYCDRLLDSSSFSDYAPNGLQVEGERPIRRLVSGVTASAALIEAAIGEEADAILVHHGWFWKGETPCLVGMKGARARLVLRAGLSLIAYHLPLDAHPELGNNATLGRRLGLEEAEPADIGGGLLWTARLPEAVSSEGFAEHVSRILERPPVLVGQMQRRLERIAWCTGGGQGHIEQAAELGVDVFLSGELSEQTTHQAHELGLCYVAAGHHATERFGVQALGDHLSQCFGLRHRFVDIENPA